MTPISVVIITYNEENNIERCIQTVLNIADEIVILDSVSTDKTKEICLKYPVKFYEQPFLGYVQQKNKALEFASYPHVLSLDADEALSNELIESIKKVKENWSADGYYFNRLTNFCGKWIKHTDWYPDRKLRLFHKKKGQWRGINPHDKYVLEDNCKTSYIKGNLLHYSFPTISHQMGVIEKFSSISAKEAYLKGKSANIFSILINPFWKFIKSYIIKLGFLDGYYGFVVCIMSSYATFIKYVKIKELGKGEIHE
jgi:glycosyltransferase involved in cell wall biosynthesis